MIDSVNFYRILKMDNISIAIPTMNRPHVLRVLLQSILQQTVFPKEIIIVDDSTNGETRIMITKMLDDFSSKNIILKYVRGRGEGVAQARNSGIVNSTGEIHFSIDDDVILDVNYIKEIMRVYSNYPNALGVAGHIENRWFSALSNSVNRVFLSFYAEKNKCRVFPTGPSYPHPLTHIIECEWFSGTNYSYTRRILKDFKFDEKFKRYSLCEDMDLSYRIQTKHPGSLLMTPYAKVIHTNSQLAKITSEYKINMDIAHHTYFFYKNMKQTFRNMVAFIYGILFGRLVISILLRNPNSVFFTIKAQLDVIKNLRNIKRGIFRSF
jgi:glycosyltransferase involved in cell wall biosynthesis